MVALLLIVAHLTSYCQARANILLSGGSLCQAWLWGYYKKGKPIFPKTFFHYRKEVFCFYRNCQWKLFKALGKHQLLLFQSLCWQNDQSRGQHDSSIVGFQKKGRLCVRACDFTPLILLTIGVVWKHFSSTGHMCIWQVMKYQHLRCFSHCNLCSWCGHECFACLCVYMHWMKWRFMLAAEWWEPQCDRQARDDLKPNNVPPWTFLLIPGHRNSGPAPIWLQNQQFISVTSTSQIFRRAFMALLFGLTVFFFLFFYTSCVFLSYLAVFVLSHLLSIQNGLFWALWMCECKQFVLHTLGIPADTHIYHYFIPNWLSPLVALKPLLWVFLKEQLTILENMLNCSRWQKRRS